MNIKKNIIYFTKVYFSMLNNRDGSLFVCGSWFGEKFTDNSKSFYLYLLKKGKNVVWITKNKTVYNHMRTSNYPVELYGSNAAKTLCKKAKYIIVSTGNYDVHEEYIGNALIINLWHGMPLKKIGFDDQITGNFRSLRKKIWYCLDRFPHRNQYYFSTSPVMTKIYKSCFRTDDKHIIEVGQARNDCFFDGFLKKRKYSNIDYEKTIFYMPTHRNEGKTAIDITEIFDLGKLNEFCKENKILFVVKKHFYHRDETTDLCEYSNIVDLTRESLDSQESLFNADILVTDYSSCYIDYLLLNRPVVFYNYDYENYLINDREMYFDYDAVTPGPKAKTFEELLNALEHSLNGNEKYKEKLEETKDFFYSKSNQGIVCPQIMEAIGRLV